MLKIKIFLGVLFVICLELLGAMNLNAQNRFSENGVDSAAIQKRINNEYAKRDSMLNALKTKRTQDSIIRVEARKKMDDYRDSVILARNLKRTSDSIARIQAREKLINDRKIKDSTDLANRKRMADSIEIAKQKAIDLQLNQKRISDSIASARQRISDSLMTARRNTADSLKEIRLAQAEERKRIQKYKLSKDYKDSVKDAQETKALALKDKRKLFNDSVNDARQLANDKIKTERQRVNDSIASIRKKGIELAKSERDRMSDSMSTIREKRKDSIAAIRAKNEKKAEEIVKKKKKELGLKIDVTQKVHDKKKEEFSNEKFLKKKWSLRRRIFQNTVTRYNYYYNAKRKYDDAIKKLTRENKDDYSKNISLLPFDVEKVGSSVASDMDSVIKKSSFSTQIHDPRSKWFDNLFFLMGQASFIKNDFDGAIQTLQFVANEYKPAVSKSKLKKNDTVVSIATVDNRKGIKRLRHHPVRNEALIWLAKAYIISEQYSEASALISTLEKDPKFPKRNKTELYLTKANLNLIQGNNDDGIASLNNALKTKSKGLQRSRMEFVLAQMYANQKDYKNSTDHFKKSIARKNSDEMNFFAKLNIAQNASLGGGDKAIAKRQLDKIINNPKFAKYKSEALNTLANIVVAEFPLKAIEYLNQSIANKENTNPTQKAKAYASLGNIYYDLTKYQSAKIAYDSASEYGSNPPIENLEVVTIRKKVLTEIVEYLHTIQYTDSLITLSKKSTKEQRAIAKAKLEILKKSQEANKTSTTTQAVALQPIGKSKSNWYFYNNTMLQDGAAQFKQKWGNRKLQDNWRRSAATSSFANSSNEEINSEEKTESLIVDGQSIETLLAGLPKTPADYDKADQKIMNAYYKLGLAYFSQLQDYKSAVKTFDTLLSRYPNTEFKKQTYYALYLNHKKLSEIEKANKYKNLLKTEFGQSEFSTLANNPNYELEKKNALKIILDHYDSTYSNYVRKNYNEAMALVSDSKVSFPNNPLKAKYDLVNALSFAGLQNIKRCQIELETIITDYPNTDEQKHAQDVLNYLKSGLGSSNDSIPEIIKPTFGTNDKSADSLVASDAFKTLREMDGKAVYVYNPNDEHFVMFFMKNVDGRAMALKSGLSDYNLLKHNVEAYTTGMNFLTEKQAIIIVQKFSNAVFAKKYANPVQNEKLLFSQLKKNEYEIALVSKTNYAEILKTRDILSYLKFYSKNYK